MGDSWKSACLLQERFGLTSIIVDNINRYIWRDHLLRCHVMLLNRIGWKIVTKHQTTQASLWFSLPTGDKMNYRIKNGVMSYKWCIDATRDYGLDYIRFGLWLHPVSNHVSYHYDFTYKICGDSNSVADRATKYIFELYDDKYELSTHTRNYFDTGKIIDALRDTAKKYHRGINVSDEKWPKSYVHTKSYETVRDWIIYTNILAKLAALGCPEEKIELIEALDRARRHLDIYDCYVDTADPKEYLLVIWAIVASYDKVEHDKLLDTIRKQDFSFISNNQFIFSLINTLTIRNFSAYYPFRNYESETDWEWHGPPVYNHGNQ